MHPDKWGKVKSLFCEVVDLPDTERDAFYESRCDDEVIKAELVQLVAMHDNDSDFLESPVGKPSAAPVPDPFEGKNVGAFVLTRRIGSGGMGVVYEATQQSPNRTAAVKLLQPTQTSTKALWRFQHESEILGRLQHPGIAHVYESGLTDFGHGQQPWFAMEFVDGEPLHRFVRTEQLSTAQKLRLLIEICDAVQHAHQRGVIHRDLKPANIIVASAEGQVRPKVLDFGVARVIEDGGNADNTIQTEFGELVGTLNYMSPERFNQNPESVDHRCDVYSLGVIGYEMLADQVPINASSENISDAIRLIAEEEPKPLGRFASNLRGDLEVIFARALEKEPQRRYQSASEFADDIRRYLNNEPIHARRASNLYRFGKFVARNRAVVAGTVATLVALTAGLLMYAGEAKQSRLAAADAKLEANKAQYEADKATAVNNFMVNDFFTKLLGAVRSSQSGDRLPLQKIVDDASANIYSMFGDRPAIEAAVRNEVATVYYNIGQFERSGEEFQKALRLWESELGATHPDTLKAVNNLGMTAMHRGQVEEAESLYRRALTGRIEVLGESDEFTIATMNNLAELLRRTDRVPEAKQMLSKAHRLQTGHGRADDKLTLTVMANLGSLLAKEGNVDEAIKLHRAVYESTQRTLGARHVTSLRAGSRFAQTLHKLGRFEEARMVLDPAAQAFREIHGPSHMDCIITRRLMSRIKRDLGDRPGARDELNEALNAANADPAKFASAIEKIERDIRRLDRTVLGQ